MRKGRWISLGLTVGVGVLLGLTSGGVSAQEQQEGSGEVQERGLQPGTGGCRGCGVDLVPVRVSPIFNCGKSANGQHLIVPIANLGSTPAPASILHVEFNGDGGYGVRDVNVPPINPFSLTRVAVNFPTGCPPCRFDIRVDANGAVTETGGPAPQWAESNNVANGQCTQ